MDGWQAIARATKLLLPRERRRAREKRETRGRKGFRCVNDKRRGMKRISRDLLHSLDGFINNTQKIDFFQNKRKSRKYFQLAEITEHSTEIRHQLVDTHIRHRLTLHRGIVQAIELHNLFIYLIHGASRANFFILTHAKLAVGGKEKCSLKNCSKSSSRGFFCDF